MATLSIHTSLFGTNAHYVVTLCQNLTLTRDANADWFVHVDDTVPQALRAVMEAQNPRVRFVDHPPHRETLLGPPT